VEVAGTSASMLVVDIKYHRFYVLYPFVTYLLTLTPTKEKTIAVQLIGFAHQILVFVTDAKLY
jgi:hypothetical protein